MAALGETTEIIVTGFFTYSDDEDIDDTYEDDSVENDDFLNNDENDAVDTGTLYIRSQRCPYKEGSSLLC